MNVNGEKNCEQNATKKKISNRTDHQFIAGSKLVLHLFHLILLEESSEVSAYQETFLHGSSVFGGSVGK